MSERWQIGNIVSSVATPIARVLQLDCYDPVTQNLRPESGCAKMRDQLNAGQFAQAFYDRFWKKGLTKMEQNEYIVTTQVAVMASSPQEAVTKYQTEGRSIGLNVTLRPDIPGQTVLAMPRPATAR